MHAISVLQPWATALLGPKDVENRTWILPTCYLDVPLALHASKRISNLEFYEFLKIAEINQEWKLANKLLVNRKGLPFGAIIGVITFSACVVESTSPWFAGPVGWVKESVIALPMPIPCQGALGIWKVPPDIADLVGFAV